MNGGTIRFGSADINKDNEITDNEWSERVQEVEKFRSRYKTHGLLAIQIDSEGIIEDHEIRVIEKRAIPEVPSPITDGSYVYLVKNGGILSCLELQSGKSAYQMRTGGRGTHYASPLIADGKLFCIAGNGRITVLTLGPDPKILATNNLNEKVYATPAIADDTLYVRTHSNLYAFQGD